MEQETQLQGQIAQVLIRFADVHLRLKPRAALVDIHERSIVVTLEDMVPPVERDYARDNQGHELLDKSYTCVYACMRRMAEIELEQIFLVVDEYGGTAGIPTLEDAVETLLGVEIMDELGTVEDMRKWAVQLWDRRKHRRL
ncbi:MAG: Na-translocating system protein MpsC family protein [Phycisphaerae bacterium]|nr:Na-translocating system protein MpsC family protein [Phycisphaerae bacterium]